MLTREYYQRDKALKPVSSRKRFPDPDRQEDDLISSLYRTEPYEEDTRGMATVSYNDDVEYNEFEIEEGNRLYRTGPRSSTGRPLNDSRYEDRVRKSTDNVAKESMFYNKERNKWSDTSSHKIYDYESAEGLFKQIGDTHGLFTSARKAVKTNPSSRTAGKALSIATDLVAWGDLFLEAITGYDNGTMRTKFGSDKQHFVDVIERYREEMYKLDDLVSQTQSGGNETTCVSVSLLALTLTIAMSFIGQ